MADNSTTRDRLRAITVKQPWAELIASGEKRYENRTWPTRHEGPLAIHAARNADEELARDAGIDLDRVTRGAIIAVAKSVRCVTLRELQDELGTTLIEHATGPYCWILSDVVRLPEPIFMQGKQALWFVPADAADEIARLL